LGRSLKFCAFGDCNQKTLLIDTANAYAPAAAVLSATIAGLLSGIAGPPVAASSVPLMIAPIAIAHRPQ
jgi:hypothetical protein